MYGVYLIAVLVAIGGAIAFIGDRLGTKIGKKRLSIFGLRPRHTSIIVTIFTGICITLLTFAVMAAVSKDVRTALFGMEQLRASMEGTRQELAQAMERLAFARSEQEAANDALAQSRQEIEQLKQEEQELAQESERLKEGNEALEGANRELAGQNAELAGQNAELSGENAELAGRNEQLASDAAALESRAKALRDGLITMREGNIEFQAGEVLASGVIPGGRSLDAVALDMDRLVQEAAQNVARRQGGDTAPELWVYPPEYDAALQSIADSDSAVIVRVLAAGNLLKGEAVRTSLDLHPNRTIYRKGEFILAKAYRVSANEDAEPVVRAFLKDVNATATEKGILPDPVRGSVGVMDGGQFYAVVQSIVPLRGTIVLSAYAQETTDALGPLRLDLKLEELPHEGR